MPNLNQQIKNIIKVVKEYETIKTNATILLKYVTYSFNMLHIL